MADPITASRLQSIPRREFIGQVTAAGAAVTVGQVARPATSDKKLDTAETFRSHIDETFCLHTKSGTVAVQLARVDTPAPDPGRPHHVRQDPFSLTFHAPPGSKFTDQICRVQHPNLGQLTAFVSNVDQPKRYVKLQAVFG